MIKSILTLAAGAMFSMHASAGYVQYDLNGPLSGYFIQHDTDKSIAYFNVNLFIDGTFRPFRMNLSPQQSEGGTQLTFATTSFRGPGPTNFGIGSNFGADQETILGVTFSRGTAGAFNYVADYKSSIFFDTGWENFAGRHFGSASVGVVDPMLAAELDRTGGYYETLHTRIIPTFVPEPSSIALLAIGAVGLLNMRRRRQA